jgi:hypothetical protein
MIIENWSKIIPKEQLLLFVYEEMFETPKAHLETACSFLGVDPLGLPWKATDIERANHAPGAEIPHDIFEALREYYAPSVEYVEKHLGREITQWTK